jgi:hypothetical protein
MPRLSHSNTVTTWRRWAPTNEPHPSSRYRKPDRAHKYGEPMGTTAQDRNRARRVIVAGFVIAAIGELTSFISWIWDGSLRYSSNEDVQSFAATFAVVAGAAVWWFLSQIIVNDLTPRVLVRKALLSLVLEQLFLAVASLAFVAVAYRHLAFSWAIQGNTLVGLGALISAVGFYSMLRTYQEEPNVVAATDRSLA